MPKQKTDHLVQLINSLEKAEKRHFRIYVKRNNPNEDTLFMQVFNLIEKSGVYQEAVILKKVPQIKRQQLSNIKSNLYNQILAALRILHSKKDKEIRLGEQVDYARVLYNKGMYAASIEILGKARKMALEIGSLNLALEALDLEKHIELQHVTGSMSPKAEELSKYAEKAVHAIGINHKLSSLSLNLYGLYLKYGYVNNQKDYEFLKHYFESNLPEYNWEQLDFKGRIFLCQSYVWYSNMIQDFLNYYRYATRWVNAFHDETEYLSTEIPLYIKGVHNQLNALFLAQKYQRYVETFSTLEAFYRNPPRKLNQNEASICTMFYMTHRINGIYMTGRFTEGLKAVPEILKAIKAHDSVWDSYRVTRFYYKIACLYFGAGKVSKAVDYLNRILNSQREVRPDIQAFTRFLCLISHYELGNHVLVSYQIKSLYRFLSKMDTLDEVQHEIFKFLRKTPRLLPQDVKRELQRLKTRLENINEKPYERRSFIYLDFLSWLESHIEGTSIEAIIQRKYKEAE